MRNAKLTILAVLSLVMLAVLAWGYVGILGLGIAYVSVTPGGKTTRGGSIEFGHGRFFVWRTRLKPNSFGALPPAPGVNVYPDLRFDPYNPWLDSLWGFHIGRNDSTDDYRITHLACPIWFAALPFTIAPIAWLRRRRRRETRGFAVERTAQGEMQSNQAGEC